MITEPGVYELTDAEYHADPVAGGSLSSTGARRLLPPSCPAKFKWLLDHPVHKDEFDLGHAAHLAVLGAGPEIVVVDADSWHSQAARDAKADAYAAGQVPLLVAQAEVVAAMADALKQHPLASALFRPGSGLPERTLVWRDVTTGVWCRARPDWLRHPVAGQRLVIPDYKTTTNAHPDAVQKAIGNFGYHIQGAWYSDGAVECGLAPDGVVFLIVAQEKTPPYLVSVVQPTPTAMEQGSQWGARAREIYAHCRATDTWPGYGDEPVARELPPYVERQFTVAQATGFFEQEL